MDEPVKTSFCPVRPIDTFSVAILQETVRAMRKEQNHQLGAERFACKGRGSKLCGLHVWISKLWSKTLCLKQKQSAVNSACKCWKGYWSSFRDGGHSFEVKERRCPCIFWHNSVALPGAWRRGGDHSPTRVTSVFPKGVVSLIRIKFQDVEDMIKNVTAELQFRWTTSVMWKGCSTQGRLLWRKIEHDLLFDLVCLFFTLITIKIWSIW